MFPRWCLQFTSTCILASTAAVTTYQFGCLSVLTHCLIPFTTNASPVRVKYQQQEQRPLVVFSSHDFRTVQANSVTYFRLYPPLQFIDFLLRHFSHHMHGGLSFFHLVVHFVQGVFVVLVNAHIFQECQYTSAVLVRVLMMRSFLRCHDFAVLLHCTAYKLSCVPLSVLRNLSYICFCKDCHFMICLYSPLQFLGILLVHIGHLPFINLLLAFAVLDYIFREYHTTVVLVRILTFMLPRVFVASVYASISHECNYISAILVQIPVMNFVHVFMTLLFRKAHKLSCKFLSVLCELSLTCI